MNLRSVLAASFLLSTLTACEGVDAPELGDEDLTRELLDDDVSTEKGAKTDVCHLTGSGAINILSVSTSAVAAHLAHGDHLAGTYYYDADGDGQGDAGVTSDCLDPGYVENSDDCDDDDDSTYLGAEEVCDDEIDNDCDGDVDEDCTVEVHIDVNADNGVWAWVNGEPVALDYTYPDWGEARGATLELDSGEDYAFSFYVEDWGGLAYFVASVEVDGVVMAATGDGDFASTGGISSSYINEWPRIAAWADTPDDSSDWPNLIFDPGSTWGDWMQAGFDDSSWAADTSLCTYPSNWNTAHAATYFTGFADLYAAGAEFVWHDFGVYPAAYNCLSVGDSATAWRTELSL